MKIITSSIIYVTLLLSACDDNPKTSDVSKIEFGTSFGMCAGYCTQILTVSEGAVSKTIKPQVSQNLEEKSCDAKYDGFNDLLSKVNVDAFMQLDDVIGCPDCADGGSEWIEITTSQGSKKVTYEYGKEPKAVQSIIDELRSQYDRLDECE